MARGPALPQPKLQKSILSHAHAVAYVNMTTDELHHLSSCHLESLSMKYGSCLVTNFASAPLFEIAADDFALSLRARMHLPCRIAPFYNMPAHLLLSQNGVATYVHNAIRDSICETAILADHAVRVEQRGVYGERHTACLLYTSPSPRDRTRSRMPSSA